uniref:H15 domain-containing protein n=1 Tax=Parascaris univalens TaxID=6257 RepID=A0A914ZRA1_PARUN
MSAEVAVPSSPAAPEAKRPLAKKTGVAKRKKGHVAASHPAYGEMVKAAVVALKEKKGSSRAAILKYILQHYKVGDNLTAVNAHLRQALKRGVSSGALKQTKGTGASGSFRLGEGKKTETVKAKKPAAKKTTTGRAPVVKKSKSPKKATVAKPKKAKSSPKKAGATPKKAVSPKKPKASKPKTVKKSAPKAKKAAA